MARDNYIVDKITKTNEDIEIGAYAKNVPESHIGQVIIKGNTNVTPASSIPTIIEIYGRPSTIDVRNVISLSHRGFNDINITVDGLVNPRWLTRDGIIIPGSTLSMSRNIVERVDGYDTEDVPVYLLFDDYADSSFSNVNIDINEPIYYHHSDDEYRFPYIEIHLDSFQNKITKNLALLGSSVKGNLKCLRNSSLEKLVLMGCNVSGKLSDIVGRVTDTIALIGCSISDPSEMTDEYYITGQLSDFLECVPNSIYLNSSYVYGHLADLDGRVTKNLSLVSCGADYYRPDEWINGELSDLRGNLTESLNLYNTDTVSGDLDDLGGNLTKSLITNMTITGDLSSLRGNLTQSLSVDYQITGNLADLRGNLTDILRINTYDNIEGNLADLGGNLKNNLSITNFGNDSIKGSLASLQGNLTRSLSLDGCYGITGSLVDLGVKIRGDILIKECPSITGGFPITPSLTSLSIDDCNGIIDSFANLTTTIKNTLSVIDCPNITGAYNPSEETLSTIVDISLEGTGQSTSDVNQTLINIANKVNNEVYDRRISLNNRSSTSTTAVNKLKSLGWIIYCGGVKQ